MSKPTQKPQSTQLPNPTDDALVNNAAPSTPSPNLPEQWMIELREILDKHFEGLGYKETVDLWVEFEHLIDLTGKKKTRLSASERPLALKVWL